MMAYGTAVRLTRDRTEAEDLVQDAALLAFRAFGSFQPGTNFKAWCFRILTNAFYSRHRKTKHERGNVSTEDLPALYLYAKTAEIGLHSHEPDPAAAMMDRFDSDQVGQALDTLPDEYRLVASLYFIEDFSYQQIADVVGCPVSAVRSRLHRGRRMLQKALWRVAQERGIVPPDGRRRLRARRRPPRLRRPAVSRHTPGSGHSPGHSHPGVGTVQARFPNHSR